MLETIIRNANVNGDITDIGITGDKITAVEKKIQLSAPSEFDASGRVTIPGFIDCHMHLDKSYLIEKADAAYVDGTGAEKGALTRKYKKEFTVEDIYNRAEKVILHALKSGTLALRTNVDVDAIVGLKGIEALIALREKYKNRVTIQIAAFAQEGIFADGETDKLLIEALKMGADLIGGHTITCGEGKKHIDFILNTVNEYDVPADFHLDESGSRADFLLPYVVEKADSMGLGARINAIHMCTLAALSPEERRDAIRQLEKSGIKATIAPTAISTRALAPVKELLESGIVAGLGSDNVRDFFNPLGSGDIKQAAMLLSYLQRFFTEKEQKQIWDMMTVNGAEILGIEQFGITEGAIADITVLDAKTAPEVIALQADPVYLMRSGAEIK